MLRISRRPQTIMPGTFFADPIIGKTSATYTYVLNFGIFICATFSRPNYCGAPSVHLQTKVYIQPSNFLKRKHVL